MASAAPMDRPEGDAAAARTLRRFMEVSVQRGPLKPNQTRPALRADEVMAVIKQIENGANAWNNFRRAFANEHKAVRAGSEDNTSKIVKDLLCSKGVTLFEVKFGSRKSADGVLPEQLPKFVKIVCRQDKATALHSLEDLDLKETLVARELEEADAINLINEEVKSLSEDPEDQVLLERLGKVFGTSVSGVRYMRTPAKDGKGTVLVFAAIDLVIMAKGCLYDSARVIIQRIFKDYYGIDLGSKSSSEPSSSSSSTIHFSESTTCALTETTQGPEIIQNVYQVRFFVGERGGGNNTLALDVQGAAELLCLIPGSDFSAQMRRRAVDVLLRVEGGDESLIDRIQANRKFQSFLQSADPNHPLRAVGEYAEKRQVEEAQKEKKRKADLEAEIDLEKKRKADLMFEVEYQLRLQDLEARKAEVETKKAEAQARKAEAEKSHTMAHETFRRERALTITTNLEAFRALGGELSPRTNRIVHDQLRTALVGSERSDGELGKPVYISKFLEKELHLTPAAAHNRASAFGKKVKAHVAEQFPDYQISSTYRTVNGSDRDINMYYEQHLPAIYGALEEYKKSMTPIREEELSASGNALALRSAQTTLSSFLS